MNKFLMLLVIIGGVFATPVLAGDQTPDPKDQPESWTYVGDSDNGARIMADAAHISLVNHDFDFGKHRKIQEKLYVTAPIKIITDKYPDGFNVAVFMEHDACIKHQNGVIYMGVTNMTKYYWDIHGTRVYDTVGAWLCGFTMEVEHIPAPPYLQQQKPESPAVPSTPNPKSETF